jgi:LacI family transcriptional regulator
MRIPEDVAILGVDNDDLICNLMVPPMSSIELGAHRIGYKAAQLLDEAMQTGQPVKPDL